MTNNAAGLFNAPVSTAMPDTGISAKQQMQFQEALANSAHQREVADLKAAGLNPVLSSGGSGAASPNGSQDSAETIKLLSSLAEVGRSVNGGNNGIGGPNAAGDVFAQNIGDIVAEGAAILSGINPKDLKKQSDKQVSENKKEWNRFVRILHFIPGIGQILNLVNTTAQNIYGDSFFTAERRKDYTKPDNSARDQMAGRKY